MSFEGYWQLLCEKGHYDVLDEFGYSDIEEYTQCKICNSKIIWRNLVDITNGSYDDDNQRIDNYITLEVDTEKKCSHCNSTLEITYKIPKRK